MSVSRTVEICNQRGLHARASAAFSRMAQQYQSRIVVLRDDIYADGQSIMELLSLAASKGCILNITAEGPDAEDAVRNLAELVENKFGEDI